MPVKERERERRDMDQWMDVSDGLTGLYKNFRSGRYGSVPVGSIGPTLIDNHCRNISPTDNDNTYHCRFLRQSGSDRIFPYQPAVMCLSVSVLKFR